MSVIGKAMSLPAERGRSNERAQIVEDVPRQEVRELADDLIRVEPACPLGLDVITIDEASPGLSYVRCVSMPSARCTCTVISPRREQRSTHLERVEDLTTSGGLANALDVAHNDRAI